MDIPFKRVDFEISLDHFYRWKPLVRYNLHSAARTGDFTFFKALQGQLALEGPDHVAAFQSALGDDADVILHALDDLNAGMAYVHQDSFKAVYGSVRSSISEDRESRLAKLLVDAHHHKQRAEFAFDKLAISVINFIQQQPAHTGDAVATVWMVGITVVADAVKVCLDQLDRIELWVDDFVRLESSWHSVQTAVEASVSAIRGISSLMATSENGSSGAHQRSTSVSSAASSTSSVTKRLSNALFHPPPAYTSGSNSSSSSMAASSSRNPSFSYSSDIRAALSIAHPDHVPTLAGPRRGPHERRLSTIPPTPFGPPGEEINSFEASFDKGTPAW